MPVHVIIIMLCLIDSVMNAACACLLQLIFICLYKCNEYDGCFDLHNAVDHHQLSEAAATNQYLLQRSDTGREWPPLASTKCTPQISTPPMVQFWETSAFFSPIKN